MKLSFRYLHKQPGRLRQVTVFSMCDDKIPLIVTLTHRTKEQRIGRTEKPFAHIGTKPHTDTGSNNGKDAFHTLKLNGFRSDTGLCKNLICNSSGSEFGIHQQK